MPGSSTLLRALLDVALPPCCVLCAEPLGSALGLVCSDCWRAVRLLPAAQCARCGYPAAADAESCRWCRLLPTAVARCRSWCWVPEGTGGPLVHALKYGGWPRVGASMGARMAGLPGARPPAGRAVIIPAPLSATRLRERGYNQAEPLARALARHWQAPLRVDALQRGRDTGSQVRLTPAERSANVQGAFVVGPGVAAVQGAHVVLVDDVITTAATLSACAAVLVDRGPASIRFITFGRARAAWDRMTPSWSSPP